jgi:hypothetical protein
LPSQLHMKFRLLEVDTQSEWKMFRQILECGYLHWNSHSSQRLLPLGAVAHLNSRLRTMAWLAYLMVFQMYQSSKVFYILSIHHYTELSTVSRIVVCVQIPCLPSNCSQAFSTHTGATLLRHRLKWHKHCTTLSDLFIVFIIF